MGREIERDRERDREIERDRERERERERGTLHNRKRETHRCQHLRTKKRDSADEKA